MKLNLWFLGLIGFTNLLGAQTPPPMPQNSPQEATYKIRYKGIRCLKSKASKGDSITIYVMGYSVETKLRDTETMPLDSLSYKLQSGGFYATNSPLFTGKNAEDANLFCAILQQDQSQKTKDFWGGVYETSRDLLPDVGRLISPKQPQPDSSTLNTTPNTIVASPNSPEKEVLSSDVQKVLKFTDKWATKSLLNRTAGRGYIINKELYPLEREDVQSYLKAERKSFERIRYHFSIWIKDDTAEYELFFDVVSN